MVEGRQEDWVGGHSLVPEGVKGGEGAGVNQIIHMHQDIRGPGSEQEWKASVAIVSAGRHQQTLRAPAQCDWAVETAPPDDVNGSHFHTVLPAHQTRLSGLYRLAHVKSLDHHDPKREVWLLPPFSRQRNGGTERLTTCPKSHS